MSEYRIIDVKEITNITGVKIDKLFQRDLSKEKVIVYDSDVVFDEDFSLIINQLPENAAGYAFMGNLEVKGTILDGDADFGPILYVKGNLEAEAITVSGSDLYIEGNVFVKKFIYTFYNHGSLIIKGNLNTKLLVINDHATSVEGVTDAIVTGDYESIADQSKCIALNFQEILNSSVLSGEYDDKYIDDSKLMKAIGSKKSLVKKEYAMLFDDSVSIRDLFKNADERIVNLIKKQEQTASQKNKQLISVKLNNQKIKSLPAYLFGLTSIEKLNLSENKLTQIPEDIIKLTHLNELNLSENLFAIIPEEICKLENLAVLDVSSNKMGEYNADFVFSDSIGLLKNLKELKSDYNKCFPLPESFAMLTNLEVLSLYQCSDEKKVDFPNEITTLTNLVSLNIGSNSFKSIPDSISKLTKLKILNLSSSLCYLKSVPDLSALKALTKLDASGSQSFSKRPYPDPLIISSFFTAPNLKELDISRYGKNGIDIKHFDGIGKLKKLEKLDISFNELKRLPEEIMTLASLKVINLNYNQIDKKDIDKLKNTIKGICIDF